MNGSEAMRIINEHEKSDTEFRVNFEHVKGAALLSDYFPGDNEPPITSEELAWELAERFAKATYGKCVNIYVINQSYVPVKGYAERIIENR